MSNLFDTTEKFDEIIREISSCDKCADMAGCTRVLSWANGKPDAGLMFVGEAPGRLGADRTAIPFHGDKAGDNFERLLALAGLRRSEVFVTNAVLCNPRDENGNNAPPSRTNLRNCASNLRRQIDVLRPRVLVTLGSAALESSRLIEQHDLTLADSVRTKNDWYGRTLIPLYHPGARAMIHRNFAAQTADYYFVGETFRRASSNSRRRAPRSPAANSYAWDVVQYVLARLGSASLFRLHKALFLLDLRASEDLGESITGFYYIRQKDGPYCVELGGGWHRAFQETIRFRQVGGRPYLEWLSGGLLDERPQLHSEHESFVDQTLSSISALSDDQLKSRAYLTKPMKALLALEKAGQPQINRPLL